MRIKTDFAVDNHGSLIAIRPLTDAAQAWLADNVQAEGWQYLGRALCVDARLAYDIVVGIQEDGLTVH